MSWLDLDEFIKERRGLINDELALRLPAAGEEPMRVHEAMRYAALGDAKRLRPLIALSVCDLAEAPLEAVMDAACAVEFVHTASLILDDLPSMDNALQRRDKPCAHLVFGEATAVLAGMGLVALGFELTARNAEAAASRAAASRTATGRVATGRTVQELAKALGTRGIICGQHMDLRLTGKVATVEELEFVHRHKAGALFVASVRIPAILLHLDSRETGALEDYARQVGLAFQISDDVLDAGLASEDGGEMNFAARLGKDEALRRVEELITNATGALDLFESRAEPLRGLADFVRVRAT